MKVKQKQDRSPNEPAAELLGGYATDSKNLLDLRQSIELRAYELWVQRGCGDGGAINDWLQAEAEINSSSDKGKGPISETGGVLDAMDSMQRVTHLS